jgi:hypothetical protein
MTVTRTRPAGGGAARAAARLVADGHTGSRARRVAFRVLAWVTSLEVLVLFLFGLMEVVFMWLPDATVVSMFDDIAAADLVHRGHFNSIGIVSWAFVPVVLVQLRNPERRVAAMLLAVAIVLTGTVVYGLSGSLTAWLLEEIILLVSVLLLAWLHPRAGDLVRRPRLDRAMIGLVALAAAPWLVFASTQAQLQWRNVAGDSHADMEHWATSALMAVIIVVAGMIGSTDHTGWRLPAWIAALASIDYGVHSLVFPDVASNASTLWAVAAVAWGCAYAVTIVRRSRRPVRAAPVT